MKHDASTPATVAEALSYCHERLEQSGVYFGHGTDNAWDEAVQLVLSVAALPLDSGDGVLPHPITPAGFSRIEELLQQRIDQRQPLPYLLGKAWFAGLEFLCDSRAIVPRSPIAELIRRDFIPWYSGPAPTRVLDLCCGGGCIGLATAYYLPEVQVDLVDIDEGALSLARENARKHDLQARCNVLQSDLFSAVGGNRYDLIVSNPPYVDARDLATMPKEFRAEPEISLGSGSDGLEITRRILARAGEHLSPEGLLIVEVGNSGAALEEAYPTVPFTWIEFACGGDGVFALTAGEWQDYSESLRQ